MDLIQSYGEDDGSDGSEHCESSESNQKLPIPNSIVSMFDGRSYHPKPDSNPDSHQGRIRSFEHERGNWASIIYAPCTNGPLVEAICEHFSGHGLEVIKDPHISLTKTFVLQYHWIQRFIYDVKSKLSRVPKFNLHTKNLEVFCNDNRTRTFIGFLVQPPDMLSLCVDLLDDVLSEYNLPKYYEDPIFHLSVAWCLGDQSSQLKTKLKSLESEIGIYSDMLRIESLICKTGKKIYRLDLD